MKEVSENSRALTPLASTIRTDPAVSWWLKTSSVCEVNYAVSETKYFPNQSPRQSAEFWNQTLPEPLGKNQVFPDNNHKTVGGGVMNFLQAFSFFPKLMNHLYIHPQNCSGLIKHLLSDCLLCCWFSSIWLQPLWSGLILSILRWEITRGWQDWGKREEKCAVAFRANQQDWEGECCGPSICLPASFSLSGFLALCVYRSIILFFFHLSQLLSFASALSLRSLMRAGGVSQ